VGIEGINIIKGSHKKAVKAVVPTPRSLKCFTSRVGDTVAQIQEAASYRSPRVQQEDEKQRRQLRWCFFIILSIWTLLSVATPIGVFYLTKSLYSFSLYSTLAPPIYLWYRFARHVFPLDDEKTFELEKKRKINNHAHPSTHP
jgi:hypothetical protein